MAVSVFGITFFKKTLRYDRSLFLAASREGQVLQDADTRKGVTSPRRLLLLQLYAAGISLEPVTLDSTEKRWLKGFRCKGDGELGENDCKIFLNNAAYYGLAEQFTILKAVLNKKITPAILIDAQLLALQSGHCSPVFLELPITKENYNDCWPSPAFVEDQTALKLAQSWLERIYKINEAYLAKDSNALSDPRQDTLIASDNFVIALSWLTVACQQNIAQYDYSNNPKMQAIANALSSITPLCLYKRFDKKDAIDIGQKEQIATQYSALKRSNDKIEAGKPPYYLKKYMVVGNGSPMNNDSTLPSGQHRRRAPVI
jgi:hypothetical protein